MTQAPAAEPIELAIVSCETCDQLFLFSPRRETCPTCGGPVGLTFFEFLATADSLRLKNGTTDVAAAPAPAAPPAPAAAGPEEEEEQDDEDEEAEEEPREGRAMLLDLIDDYLDTGEGTTQVIRDGFLHLGATPGLAAVAVDNLAAVREILVSLTGAPPTQAPAQTAPEPAQAPQKADQPA